MKPSRWLHLSVYAFLTYGVVSENFVRSSLKMRFNVFERFKITLFPSKHPHSKQNDITVKEHKPFLFRKTPLYEGKYLRNYVRLFNKKTHIAFTFTLM